ncbi:hypothetical protein LXA43DRAFT_1099016 [Ganoderma leucocontextum]|nr:hypothetical protein LXA43DRAFT_1099016 [Ganoderma leucocontextum]
MSAIHVSAEEMSSLYTTVYCVYAACMILVYDWLLCLGQEVRYIWNWDSGLTGTSLVYALSRYMLLIQTFLAVVTNYQMSDLSVQLQRLEFAIPNAQSQVRSAANVLCDDANERTIALSSITLVTRVSQLAAELLVVGMTWWYTYQSYRIRKDGIKLGKSISSLLIYNGSIYFLFLASLYVIDVIFSTASVPDSVVDADSLLELFYDPITSLLVCHFMLSLRRFDSSSTGAMTYSGAESQSREHTTSSGVLHFAAQPSDTLPHFIASFAQPVHFDSFWSETDADAMPVDEESEWREMDLVAVARKTQCGESPVP